MSPNTRQMPGQDYLESIDTIPTQPTQNYPSQKYTKLHVAAIYHKPVQRTDALVARSYGTLGHVSVIVTLTRAHLNGIAYRASLPTIESELFWLR